MVPMSEILNIPEIFGCDVFNEATMKQRLSADVYDAWKQCITTDSALPLHIANEIADAMKQNMYLQREITAARELYNDTVNAWNRAIFSWPTKQIVAARNGYTTRLPFIASKEIKEKANDVFF